MSDSEVSRIRERYQRRASLPPDRYSLAREDVFRGVQAVDRATMTMLQHAGLADFARLRLLEVGCGTGGNLLRFLRWGFAPQHLAGNDLLDDRLAEARRVLPAAVELRLEDASKMTGEPFDIVYQSTVFSSILSDDLQRQVADTMWALTKPGGIVLSYDFTFNNPHNPDVRKVPVSRLEELFPHGKVRARKVTLAPPLARRVARWGPVYSALEALPPLRTHVLAAIRRPL